MSSGAFVQGTSGWRRTVPVDEQGASSSTASNSASGAYFSTSASTVPAGSRSRLRFSSSRLSRLRDESSAVTLGAGQRQLRRLAAGCGAKVGDAPAGDIAEQSCRQARGRILDPPLAVGEARQVGNRGGQPFDTDRAGRQHDAAESLSPAFGIGLHREVDRRLDPMRGEDRLGLHRAIGGGQPVAEPFRRVVAFVELGRQSVALVAGDAAQDAVDQAGEALGARVGLGVRDGEVDRGAVGDVEEQDLRGSDVQHMRKLMRIGRQRPLEPPRDQPRNRAAIPQRRRQDRAHQRPVAHLERAEVGMAVVMVGEPVERRACVDDRGEQLCRRLARRQPRDLRRRCRARLRCSRPRSGRRRPCRVVSEFKTTGP